MKISIIGSGVVGQNIGKALAKYNKVMFYDINENKIKEISKEYSTTLDLGYAIKNSDISFLAVPTPTKNDKIDLSYIDKVTKESSQILKNKDKYHIFTVKSTIVPSTTEKLIIPNLEKYSNKKHDKDFGVIYNPEFLTEISGSWTKIKEFKKTPYTEDRVVLGESKNKKAGDIVAKLYKPFKIPIIRTDYKTAEFIKYAANARLATAISYSNEMFLLAERLGIDGQFVANVVAMDSRIGKYGSKCGLAFGGKCLPKDLAAFIKFSEDIGYEAQLLKAVHNVNRKIAKKRGVRE